MVGEIGWMKWGEWVYHDPLLDCTSTLKGEENYFPINFEKGKKAGAIEFLAHSIYNAAKTKEKSANFIQILQTTKN